MAFSAKSIGRSLAALGIVAFGLAVPATGAGATNFVVTSTASSGAGSLTAAIDAANASAGADTITFAASTNGHVLTADTIENNHGLTTIKGNGAGKTLLDSIDVNSFGSEVSAGAVSGVSIESGGLDVNSGRGGTTTGTFTNIAVKGSVDVNSGGTGSKTTATITDASVTGGSSVDINSGGASTTTATLTRVDVEGSGIDVNSSESTTTATINQVTVNKAEGDGISANDPGTTVTVNASTISNNQGIGLDDFGSKVTVTNSTFFKNFSDGDGVFDVVRGSLTLQNVTAAHNDEGLVVESGRADVTNTILANNGTDGECQAGDASLVSHGGNLSDDGSCPFTQTADQQKTDPKLGDLADNKGPTLTMLPATGSPAIDHGVATGCPGTDQRGVARPQDGNNDGTVACDSGAVEVAAVVEATTTTTTSTTAAPEQQQATPTTVVAELPRTGSSSGGLAVLGIGTVAVGALALAFASRSKHRSRRLT